MNKFMKYATALYMGAASVTNLSAKEADEIDRHLQDIGFMQKSLDLITETIVPSLQ